MSPETHLARLHGHGRSLVWQGDQLPVIVSPVGAQRSCHMRLGGGAGGYRSQMSWMKQRAPGALLLGVTSDHIIPSHSSSPDNSIKGVTEQRWSCCRDTFQD